MKVQQSPQTNISIHKTFSETLQFINTVGGDLGARKILLTEKMPVHMLHHWIDHIAGFEGNFLRIQFAPIYFPSSSVGQHVSIPSS